MTESTERVRQLVSEALFTDGGHHKQWYLYEIAKLVLSKVEFEQLDVDRGIAP